MDPSRRVNALPLAPTASLIPLGRLYTRTTFDIQQSLSNLQSLYFPSTRNPLQPLLHSRAIEPGKTFSMPMPLLGRRKGLLGHMSGHTSVPDSGYASCEEDEGLDDATSNRGVGDNDDKHGKQASQTSDPNGSGNEEHQEEENQDNDEIEILRSDPLERAFAIKWLTGFVARFDEWAAAQALNQGEDGEDGDEAQPLFHLAIALLADFARGDDDEEVALTRKFSFPFRQGHAASADVDDAERSPEEVIEVELNDAPLSKEDHTSVGLQSWGSAIVFARRFCADPGSFIPSRASASAACRVLELGAGTGMLSIVAAKILHRQHTWSPATQVVATDYHPNVLENLHNNVRTNFPLQRSSVSVGPDVLVTSLDWESPHFDEAPFDRRFEVILAADVIYHPSHATWIKSCVENLLNRSCGVFWLIIPIRSTGRHEGIDRSVDEAFPLVGAKGEEATGQTVPRLVTLVREDIERQTSIGRMDEGGYRLFKIGWV